MERYIKFFHRMYARYKRPDYLEIAAILGKVPKTEPFEEIWARKVEEGHKQLARKA